MTTLSEKISALALKDEQLMREVLKVLKRSAVVMGIAAAGIAPEYRGANNVYDEGVGDAAAAIAKLEERLLQE